MTDFKIGTRLRELRKQQGLSDLDVAERLGVTRVRVNQIEHPNANPRLSTVLRYCDAIGVRLEITASRP